MNFYLYLALLIELFIISYIDLRTRKISNLWPMAHMILFIGITAFTREMPEFSHFIFPIGMIVIGFVLYLFHIMGAGDCKYLGSLLLLIPTPSHMLFMEKLLTVTIFVGSILIIM